MQHYEFPKIPWFVSAPERILGNGPGLPVETAYFRISFAVKGRAECKAAVSASSRYALYVNGAPVNHGPCKGDRMQYYCDDLELGSLLREGENVIACKVVSFPPQEALSLRDGYADAGPFSVIGTASGPCLLFSGEAVDSAGAKIDLSTGYAPWEVKNDTAVSWLAPEMTMVFCHEEVDAEKIPAGWNSRAGVFPGFAPVIKRWAYDEKTYGEIAPLPLFRRPIPLLEEIEREFVKEIPADPRDKRLVSFLDPSGRPEKLRLERGTYTVDLDAGELTTGYVMLETEGGRGSEITLTYAESYGGPFSGGIRGDRLDYKKFTLGGFKDVYRPAGSRDSYEFFWWKTFRIVRIEITVGSEALILHPVKYRETGYPLEIKTGPAADADSTVSWIPGLWDISLRTLRRCMHETYEDCPYYEQMQYSFDTRLQMLFTYYVSGDTRLGLKTIDDFHRSMLPEGIIQSRYPTNCPQVIPTFSISWLSMLMDYYNQTADISALERYRPTAEHILLWFRRKKGETGLLENLGYWDFVDWAPEWGGIHGSVRAAFRGPSTVQNLMYVYGLQLMGRILGLLGFNDLGAYYLDEGRSIQNIIRERCWDEKRGFFTEGPDFREEYTRHAQMWAVLTGTVIGREAADLMERVLESKDLIKCTFPLQFYFFRALEEAGLYEKTETQWEDWKGLLSLNLSTVPETPYDNSRSECHAWSALLLYEYPAKILGVYPLEPGWKTIGIKPRGLYLGKAAGEVWTPAGTVKVSWKYEGGKFSVSGSLPAGAAGRLTLPGGGERALAGGDFAFSP
ncbi:MAG: hypothetical protein LBD78_01395 [Spirochaetaceae bacterium]|jgi:hypothetical protein|nr:hypothetical protein [Spirochaetaceae bacterium]